MWCYDPGSKADLRAVCRGYVFFVPNRTMRRSMLLLLPRRINLERDLG